MTKLKNILLVLCLSFASIGLAQIPQKMSYQAVIRNNSNALVVNSIIRMRINILQGSPAGAVVYTETQSPVTNANGLVSIEIGQEPGFATIKWENGPFFIETKIDPTGDANYSITGTSQILSVPYAFHSKSAENVTGEIPEKDPVFKESQASKITVGEITKLSNLSGVNTGDQDISAMNHVNRASLDAVTGINTGDQDLSGKVDKITGKGLSTNDYTNGEKQKVLNLSGINTGDQDLSGKVDKVTGKGLSTNDYTTPEKTKLAGIATGAEVNIQADWNQATNTADDYIKNKPAIPTQYTDGMADARVVAGITNKVDKEAGKGLSTNDYATPDKNKVASFTLGNSIGDILYWNGNAWVLLPKGNSGQVLSINSNIPTWQSNVSLLLPPTIVNTTVSNIQSFSATLNSTINPNNLSTDVVFEWGTNTGYGNSTPAVQQKITGTTQNVVNANPNLQSATTYHYRVRATNAVNTVYSGNQSFTTLPSAPILTTKTVTAVMALSASSGGNISWDGGSAVTSRGVCWSTNPSPTTANNRTSEGNGIGDFTSSISGLAHNTTYYVRAYATNAIGTSYGSENKFITQNGIISLSTVNAEFIMALSAASGGVISADGGSAVTARGVCWGISPSPTISGNKTNDGSGIGGFTSSLNGLSANTTYYCRAYATNSIGTSYGGEVLFTTMNGIITFQTSFISNVNALTASCSFDIISDGGSIVTESGVCWSTSSTPTIDNNKTIDGSGKDWVTSSITGLTPGTTYYVRAYATNATGTYYSNEITFTTKNGKVTFTNYPFSKITVFTAIADFEIDSDGGSIVTARGICWSTSASPTIVNNKTLDGSGKGWVTSSLTGLTPGTTYYVRAYATNATGTYYGDEKTFTTQSGIISLTTNTVINVLVSTATTEGNISADGGSAVTARGICWGTNPNPSISGNKTNDGTGTGSYTSSLTGLTANTKYYVRAYATNEVSTYYGEEKSFITSEGTITDIEANIYSYITIGAQVWMRENLKTTKYRNGDVIGTTTPYNKDISSDIKPKFQWASNGDESMVALYGRLYTWFTATDSRGICPSGWHLPSDSEWYTLENFLISNGYNFDGTTLGNKVGKAMTSEYYWIPSNHDGAIGNSDYNNYRNKSGFTVLPSGGRDMNGGFSNFGASGYLWSNTENDNEYTWIRNFYFPATSTGRSMLFKSIGGSIRCLKD